ncbi:hypothetical protein LTR85_007688 [Meristemomyces frigidus]|nr:hypothetical protein LTR85_007688 [Meristemomyces frigidus]
MASSAEYRYLKYMIDTDDYLSPFEVRLQLQILNPNNVGPETLKRLLLYCKRYIENLREELEFTCDRLRDLARELGQDRYRTNQRLRDVCKSDLKVAGPVDNAFLEHTDNVGMLADVLDSFIMVKRQMGGEKKTLDEEEAQKQRLMAATTLVQLGRGVGARGVNAEEIVTALSSRLTARPIDSARDSPDQASSANAVQGGGKGGGSER